MVDGGMHGRGGEARAERRGVMDKWLESFFRGRGKDDGGYEPPRERLVEKLDPDLVMRVHLMFAGRVQGVGFRFTQLQFAERRGITGWVRNLDNGDVEAEWQGSGSDIRAMVDDLHAYYRKFKYSFEVTQCDQIPLKEGEADFRARY